MLGQRVKSHRGSTEEEEVIVGHHVLGGGGSYRSLGSPQREVGGVHSGRSRTEAQLLLAKW